MGCITLSCRKAEGITIGSVKERGMVVGASVVCTVSIDDDDYLMFRASDGKFILKDGGVLYVLKED